MIRKIKLQDIDRILDIWINVSIEAHNFIPREYWEQNKDDMQIFIYLQQIFMYTRKIK